ncbi:30928_t:CDS:1, partial [Gigaspora margarita]
MASDEIEKTINKLENDLLQINENKEYPVIDTVSDVITLFAKAFKNISNVIPGSIADPIAKLFYETVLIANSAIENRKRCNELKIFVKCALENLERSLECGAKPGIDFGKINMEQYMQALAEIVEYMRELANSTISKKVWRFLTSDQ